MAENKTRLRTLVDASGERYFLTEERKPARSFGMQFHVVFDENYTRMVRRISSSPARQIFLVLPDYLTFGEFRALIQSELASDLGLSTGATSAALNELAKLGAIERKGKGPVTQWRLSMEWGWRGSSTTWHKEKRKRAEAAKKPPRPHLRVVPPQT